jgi:peptide/nickel transport system substrate-binding protein
MLRRVAVLLLLASAFVVTPLSPAAPEARGTFRVAEPATWIDSIDQALGFFAGDVPFFNVVCASLTRLADKPLPAGFRVVPELAARFPRISRDHKTYVFTLRKGVRFNTGAPVTAADVAYTINRVLRLKQQSESLAQIVGAQEVLAGQATQASGIQASGRKLTLRFTQPVQDFRESGALSLCVLPAGHPLEPGGVTPPVPSAGPYYISEYVPGQRIVLKRNVYYRGPRPQHVDAFVFDLTVDDTQALDDVVNGAADYAWIPTPAYRGHTPALARRFGVNKKQFLIRPSNFVHMFVLNTSRPLFRSNAALRRAVNFALDRPALLRQFGAYAGTPVDHYVAPIMPGYRNTHVYPLRKPNLPRARALARGHLRGGKLVLYVPTRPGVAAQAQIVKQNLARIGLDVQIVTFPGGDLYFNKLANAKEPFDMAWIGWGPGASADPGEVLNAIFDGSKIGTPSNKDYSYFNSSEWNTAFERASRLTGEARYRTYGRLDVELAQEEAPAVAYGVANALTLVSARAGCLIVNPYLDLAAVCLK